MHIDPVTDTPKILITGANGFTGQHACTYFAEAGYKVYALVRGNSSLSQENIQLVRGDLTDREALRKIAAGLQPDFVLHLAGQNAVDTSWIKPVETLEANLLGTAYLLDALRTESSQSKILVVGSILSSDPADIDSFIHPYGLSKTMQTLFAQVYSSLFTLHVVIANPSNLIGPGHSAGVCTILAKRIAQMEVGLEEPKLSVYNLLAIRDFLDVRDAITAYDMLLKKGKVQTTYSVTSGHPVTLKEVTDIFQNISGVSFEVTSEIEEKESFCSISPVDLQLLGWSRAFSLQQSLLDILDFQRKNRDDKRI